MTAIQGLSKGGFAYSHTGPHSQWVEKAMAVRGMTRPIEILHVEDSPDDRELTLEGLKEGKAWINLSSVSDGVEALEFLRKRGRFANAPRPDLILLDLNLPRKDGREVLEEIKADEQLNYIPVVVLTTSQAEQDILRSYRLHANCYITKPVDLDKFLSVISSMEDFWLSVAQLPGAVPAEERQPETKVGMIDIRWGERPAEILLVEDNPADMELAQRTLRQCPFRLNISLAEDGEAAMAHLKREGEHASAPRPDLVLLDLNMPRKNGYEVMAEMLADTNLRRIPVMILTSTQEERELLQYENYDPSRYCNKPLELDRFVGILEHLTNTFELPPE